MTTSPQERWLEPVPSEHITGLNLVPDLPRRRLLVTAATVGGSSGRVTVQALSGGRVIGTARGRPGRQARQLC